MRIVRPSERGSPRTRGSCAPVRVPHAHVVMGIMHLPLFPETSNKDQTGLGHRISGSRQQRRDCLGTVRDYEREGNFLVCRGANQTRYFEPQPTYFHL